MKTTCYVVVSIGHKGLEWLGTFRTQAEGEACRDEFRHRKGGALLLQVDGRTLQTREVRRG